MAWSKVQGAQSAGAANATSVTISAATAGNTLVSAFCQTGLNTPTCTGFTVQGVSAVYNGSLSSVWVATKIAAGGETSVSWTAGSGGTGHGVVALELAGGPATVTLDGSVVHTDNIASGTTASLAVTTGTANSIVLLFVGADTSSGTIGAWTGTNVATNVGTAAARCFGGSFITTSTVSSTFTGNWTTAHVSGMIALSLKLSSGSTAWTLSPTDTTTSTDAVVKNVSRVSSDSTTATDATTKAIGKLNTDSTAATDVVGKAVGKPTADSSTSTDAAGKAVGKPSADSTTSIDAITKAIGLLKVDTTTSTDFVAKFIGLLKTDSTTSTDLATPSGSSVIVAVVQRIHVIVMGRFGIY